MKEKRKWAQILSTAKEKDQTVWDVSQRLGEYYSTVYSAAKRHKIKLRFDRPDMAKAARKRTSHHA